MGKFLLATCRQLEEEQRQRATLLPRTEQGCLVLSLPGTKKKKKPWKARPPWKVGNSIIHLMNGDLGLKRAEQLPQVHSGQEKGGRVCQEPTLSMSGLCAFLSASLSATRDLARLPFFIRDTGIDIFLVPLLCCRVF